MSGIASSTGLIAARIRPVYRPKSKHVELLGCAKPAPFNLRPFSGLFNPYPYGCSVLCNHPADCEAKEVVRRAKDSWATAGKALLLPEEMEMIRSSLLAAVSGTTDIGGSVGTAEVVNADATTVPEELFRKYTETDSRPLTPAPTLASGQALSSRPNPDEHPVTCNPRERTTLVLDLRASSQKQENDTFTWHALTLEPPPQSRKIEVSVTKPIPRCPSYSPVPPVTISVAPSSSIVEGSGEKGEKDVAEIAGEETVIARRRGKRLSKRKCRRGSTYGQQIEVRDLLETTETQISQIGYGSRRTSIHTCNDESGDPSLSPKRTTVLTPGPTIPSSFIAPEILQHLCRELDRDKVEAEFSVKRRLAFEEALRVKGEAHLGTRGSRQSFVYSLGANVPRVFSRQAARFEILDSGSLRGLTPLEYLSKHVFITSSRKLIFGRAFNKFYEETIHNVRRISPKDVYVALEEVTGKSLTEEQQIYLRSLIGEIKESVNFRTWCGLCAVVERLLCPLPQKELDPPSWIEKADFEALERRLDSVDVDRRLALLLREIRQK